MALKRQKTIQGGITGDYWKIIHSRTDHLGGITSVILGLYLSGAVRLERPDEYIYTAVIQMAGENMARGAMYGKIKESRKDADGVETNEWAEAEDV